MKIKTTIENETEWLFYYLSCKAFPSGSIENSFPFYVPDTLIYKYYLIHFRISSNPQYWYFSSRSGEVCRKYHYNITKDNIMNRLEKKSLYFDIMGTEYKFLENGKSLLTINTRYIHKSLFPNYLNKDINEANKIFQAFVYPQGKYNCIS